MFKILTHVLYIGGLLYDIIGAVLVTSLLIRRNENIKLLSTQHYMRDDDIAPMIAHWLRDEKQKGYVGLAFFVVGFLMQIGTYLLNLLLR